MSTPIQNDAAMKEPRAETSFTSTDERAEPNDQTSMSGKDPDTMLSMVVLLVACLALAVLAHVFV
jgi:hypothetical protein